MLALGLLATLALLWWVAGLTMSMLLWIGLALLWLALLVPFGRSWLAARRARAWDPERSLDFLLESGDATVYTNSDPNRAWLRVTVRNAGDMSCDLVAYAVDFFEIDRHPVWSEGWTHIEMERRLTCQSAPAACSPPPRGNSVLSMEILVPKDRAASIPSLSTAATVKVHVKAEALVRLRERPDSWHRFECWGDADVYLDNLRTHLEDAAHGGRT